MNNISRNMESIDPTHQLSTSPKSTSQSANEEVAIFLPKTLSIKADRIGTGIQIAGLRIGQGLAYVVGQGLWFLTGAFIVGAVTGAVTGAIKGYMKGQAFLTTEKRMNQSPEGFSERKQYLEYVEGDGGIEKWNNENPKLFEARKAQWPLSRKIRQDSKREEIIRGMKIGGLGFILLGNMAGEKAARLENSMRSLGSDTKIRSPEEDEKARREYEKQFERTDDSNIPIPEEGPTYQGL